MRRGCCACLVVDDLLFPLPGPSGRSRTEKIVRYRANFFTDAVSVAEKSLNLVGFGPKLSGAESGSNSFCKKSY